MSVNCSIRFVNAKLNARLVALLRLAKVPHAVAEDGSIRYSTDDEERVENGPLQRLRDTAFPSWQLVFSPADWAARYRAYMTARGVPFEEQWADGQPCFLIPRRYRPHRWQLPGDRPNKLVRMPADAAL